MSAITALPGQDVPVTVIWPPSRPTDVTTTPRALALAPFINFLGPGPARSPRSDDARSSSQE